MCTDSVRGTESAERFVFTPNMFVNVFFALQDFGNNPEELRTFNPLQQE